MVKQTLRLEHCDQIKNFPDVNFRIPCNGIRRTVYENLLGKEVIATISLDVFDSSTPCTATMTITRDNGKKITRSVTAPVSDSSASRDIAVTVCGLKSIDLECSGNNPAEFCSGFIDIQITYCKCCEA